MKEISLSVLPNKAIKLLDLLLLAPIVFHYDAQF